MQTIHKLNFFPYYAELLRSKQKHATIRLGQATSRFRVGDNVTITVGWEEKNSAPLCEAAITHMVVKQLKDLNEEDLVGESPDCLNKDAIKYVLSAIYRKIVSPDDLVTVIKWEYENNVLLDG